MKILCSVILLINMGIFYFVVVLQIRVLLILLTSGHE